MAPEIYNQQNITAEEYDKIYRAGYEDGYERGFRKGYDQGFEVGYERWLDDD
jgi:flagellar biosynthesis/type III secretory pathway protein FliH